MKTYFIKTYGCQMNKHDSERIAGIMEEMTYKPSNDICAADIVVYYTCCVRESADEKFYGQLNSIKHKDKAIIAVGGCLAQKEGVNLLALFKRIDLVFGTQNINKLPVLISNMNGNPISDTGKSPGFTSDMTSRRESKIKAWIAINQGCNNHCTYCIVPEVRGAEISRKPADILAEAKNLAVDGVVEVTLLGQNVNSYGKDMHQKPSFSGLLEKLSKSGLKRIRFMTSHPKDLTEDVVLAMKNVENICEHIHLPVQAGSTDVLRKMGRKYSKEQYLALLDMIRSHIPQASITTDIMVGFPGETEEDFKHTLEVVKKAQFDQAFTFIYSKREGTPAAKMSDQIDYSTKLKRFKTLVELQNKISFENNKQAVNKTYEVLVEEKAKKEDGVLSGRTRSNKLVHFKGDDKLIGNLITVKAIEAKPFYLIGEIVG